MEEALGNTGTMVVMVLLLAAGLVDGVRVQSDIIDSVIKEESLQVFLTELAEKEGIDLGTELLEGKIRGSEESTPIVGLCVVEGGEETSLGQCKLEGAELSGQGRNDIDDLWRREKD
jgi:hypothetical protein